ncbi:MAG: LamG-like jellyroll fold domain-containing protein [Roseibacillus sp.]
MRRGSYSEKDVDRLAEQLRDNRMDEEAQKDLREIIRNHPKERRRLVEHLYLGAAVRDAVRTWSGQDERLASSREKVPRWVIPVLGIAAIGILAYFLLPHLKWVSDLNEPQTEASKILASIEAQEVKGIAVVSHTVGAVWGGGTTLSSAAIKSGRPVGKGRIELFEGMAQIDFYSGAVLIVEGPARLDLQNPKRAKLEYGSLRGKIPPPAKGFSVETPFFDIINDHSEFGIQVSKEGQGEVHVLSGSLNFLQDTGKEQALDEGHGIICSSEGIVTPTFAKIDNFPTWRAFDRETQQRFVQWQDYQRALMAQEDTLVGYLFARDSAWERTVRNRALQGPPDTDGAIVGCDWTKGRWPDKGSLAFSNSSHRIRLNLPGKYENLTLATWVKLDSLNSAEVSLLHPETRQKSFIHWTITKTETDGLHLHFSETDSEGGPIPPSRELRNHYHSNINLLRPKATKLGDWVHLAVVYDPEKKRVNHFQNGHLIDFQPIDEVRPLSIGVADIGNWPYREWAQGTEFEVRNLDGQIDEFIISKKAWSEEEIKELWEAGRP